MFKKNDIYKKYIEYIRYPRFRNLVDNSKIEFNFPVTFLVGKNGGGKSSTLQSLYGCPQGKSLGQYWFTTELDPIKEFESDRNCFIYGYNTNDGIREVLKQRSFREGDPDYWETAKPSLKYSMDTSSKRRTAPIIKNVEYVDFRSELSAFDKYLHFTSFSPSSRYSSKQDYLRSYTKKLKHAIENNSIIELRGYKRNKSKVTLDATQIKIINEILGKNYSEIEIIEHNLFKEWGFSIRLKSPELQYSEAFAGSGETAIVMLIYRIYNAEEESLILLDEPETSLHSGAQKRLMNFILEICVHRKHQFVISTHSPFIIEGMPDDSIKVFSTLKSTGKFIINSERNYKEAFHELEIENRDVVTIIVEDKFAKLILDEVLKKIGEATKSLFDVIYLPGGASDIKNRITTLMEFSKSTFIIFDGDQKLVPKHIDLSEIPASKQDDLKKISSLLKSQTGFEVKFHLDGGNKNNEEQKIALSKKYLDYYKTNVFYFPKNIPEDFIWDEVYSNNRFNLLYPEKNIKDITDQYKSTKDKLFYFSMELYKSELFLESTYIEFITNWLNKNDEHYFEIVGIVNTIRSKF